MPANFARDSTPHAVQGTRRAADAARLRRDAAPVVAAEVLLRRGLADDAVVSYLARTWPLDDADCQTAIDAAHILLRREHPHVTATNDE